MPSDDRQTLIRRYRASIPLRLVAMVSVMGSLLFYLLFFITAQIVSLGELSDDARTFRQRYVPDANALKDYVTSWTNDESRTEQILAERGADLENQMDAYAQFGQVGLLIAFLIHVPVAFLWLRQIIKEVREYSNAVRSKIIFEPKTCVFIKDMVAELCLKMRIEAERVVVMSTLLPLSPFVIRSKGKHRLVVSVQTIELASRKPELVRAVLAHELGHVLQHDANLGRWNRILLVATQRFLLLDFIITTLTLAIAGSLYTRAESFLLQEMGYVLHFLFFSSYGFVVMSLDIVYLFIPFFLARFFCRWLIRSSEYRADRAAVLFGVQGTDLYTALSTLPRRNETRTHLNTHPKMLKRLERIQSLDNKLWEPDP